MRLLLTGGTGYVGKPFITRCLKDGHEVVLISRKEVAISGVNSYVSDLTDIASLVKVQEKIGKVDAIVHLGALVYKRPEEDIAEQMAEVNIIGTSNLLDVFGAHTSLIINGSTAEVYGLPNADGQITEQTTPQPASYYGASKLAAEYFCNVYGLRHNVPVVNLRFSVMYGEADPIARAIPNFIRKAVHNEPLEIFGGEELRDYVHLDDIVESLICALHATKSATYNVGSGKGVSVKDAAQTIVHLADSSSELRILPRQKKAADLVLDSSAIMHDLGYRPGHVFPSGLKQQINQEKRQA